MNTERARVGWRFWVWWVLATFVGSAVGLVLGVAALGPVLGAVGLAGAGVMQWLVLRQQLSRSGWWILASSVGLAIGLVVGVAMSAAGGDDAVAAVVSLAVLGASVGIAQWLVLRRQVSRAGWWILVSVVGLAMGLAATIVVFGVGDGNGNVGGAVTGALQDAIFGGVIGAVVGAITGVIMVWLLRQPAAKELGPSQAAE